MPTSFLLRRGYRTLEGRALRRAAVTYAIAYGASAVLASAMIGSLLVIGSVALSWLPKVG